MRKALVILGAMVGTAVAAQQPANPRQQLGNMLRYWRFWRKLSSHRPHVGHSPCFAAGRVSSALATRSAQRVATSCGSSSQFCF